MVFVDVLFVFGLAVNINDKDRIFALFMSDNEQVDQLFLKLSSELSTFEKEGLKQQLTHYINHLLVHDFNRLIQLLYRVDVNEQKLKQLLRDNPQTDAAVLISDLIILRQQEKVKSRKAFKKDDREDEEEKW